MLPSSFHFFLAALIFSPLAFGATEIWSAAVMQALALAGLLMLLFERRHDTLSPLYKTPGLAPLLCLVAYAFVQTIPLPAFIVKAVAPSVYAIYIGSVGELGQLMFIPLSVQPHETLLQAFMLASYAAIYILAVQLLTDRERFLKTVAILAAFASALAVLAIIQHFTSNNKLLWIRDFDTRFSSFGTYANRNHYAGLMCMLFPVLLGAFFGSKPRHTYESMKTRFSDAISSRDFTNYLLIGTGAVLVAVSVFISLSRGGILSLSLSTLIMAILLFTRSGHKARAMTLLGISVAIVIIVTLFGWSKIAVRFDELRPEQHQTRLKTIDRPDRIEMWSNSATAAKDFLITGAGFGTFERTYTKYRTYWSDWTVNHAHNDYLELVMEGGLISVGLLSWFGLSVLLSAAATIRERHDNYSKYLLLGCLSGILSILIFSITEFNLHIGANGLYFFFLFGLAISAAHTRLHRGYDPTILKQARWRFRSLARFTAAAVLLLCIGFSAAAFTGSTIFSSIKNEKMPPRTDKAALESIRSAAELAALFDPLEPRYYYMAGQALQRADRLQDAISRYSSALSLDPMNGEYMQRLGIALAEAGRRELAEPLVLAGTEYDRGNPERYRFAIVYLLGAGKRAEAADYARRGLAYAPDRAADFIMVMMLRGIADSEIKNSLPELPAAQIAYADYLALKGRHDEAAETYKYALQLAVDKKMALRDYFFRANDYFNKYSRAEDALYVMKLAVTAFPEDGLLHFNAGVAYERLKMDNAAIEEYRRAVSLDISRTDAAKRLEDLLKKKGSL